MKVIKISRFPDNSKQAIDPNKRIVLYEIYSWIEYFLKISEQDDRYNVQLEDVQQIYFDLHSDKIDYQQAIRELGSIEGVAKGITDKFVSDYKSTFDQAEKPVDYYQELAEDRKITDSTTGTIEKNLLTLDDSLSKVLQSKNKMVREGYEQYGKIRSALYPGGVLVKTPKGREGVKSLLDKHLEGLLSVGQLVVILLLKNSVGFLFDNDQKSRVDEYILEALDRDEGAFSDDVFKGNGANDALHGLLAKKDFEKADLILNKYVDYIDNNFEKHSKEGCESLEKLSLYSLETSDFCFNKSPDFAIRLFENYGQARYKTKDGRESQYVLGDSFMLRAVGAGNISRNIAKKILQSSFQEDGKGRMIRPKAMAIVVPTLIRLVIKDPELHAHVNRIIDWAKENDENFYRSLISGYLWPKGRDSELTDGYLQKVCGNDYCLSDKSVEGMTPDQKLTEAMNLNILFKGFHGTSGDSYEKIKESGGMIAGKLLGRRVSRPTSFKQYSDQIYLSSNFLISQAYRNNHQRKAEDTGEALTLELTFPNYHLYESKFLLDILSPEEYLVVSRYKAEMNINMISEMKRQGITNVKEMAKALSFLNSMIESTIISSIDKRYISRVIDKFGRNILASKNWYKIIKASLKGSEDMEHLLKMAIRSNSELGFAGYLAKSILAKSKNINVENDVKTIVDEVNFLSGRIFGIEREDSEAAGFVLLTNCIQNLIDYGRDLGVNFDFSKDIETMSDEGHGFFADTDFFGIENEENFWNYEFEDDVLNMSEEEYEQYLVEKNL